VSDRGDLLARHLHLGRNRALFHHGFDHATVCLASALRRRTRRLGVDSGFLGVPSSALACAASRLGFDSQCFACFSKQLGFGARGLGGAPVSLSVGGNVGARFARCFSHLATLFGSFAMSLARLAILFAFVARLLMGV
jgi:hypothetical protein